MGYFRIIRVAKELTEIFECPLKEIPGVILSDNEPWPPEGPSFLSVALNLIFKILILCPLREFINIMF